MFVDRVQIEVHAGDGGDGSCSFRREKYVPEGGPDGGDGGDGGSIVVVAKHGVDSLSMLAHKKIWRAGRGDHGGGANRAGRDAHDMTIDVPPGTVVMDANQGFILKDLKNDGDILVAAKGGRGGRGNTRFKSSINRTPKEAEKGEKGEHRHLIFELKVIADVGLIGKPNAGKSTLLSRLSNARPQIADYPFTTKYPNLGRVTIDGEHTFILADIPGLIEGAHAGVGLGHEFLRHIERAGILVHLVEPLPTDGTDPLTNYHTIRSELGQYNEELVQRPEIIAVTKCELPNAQEIRDQIASDTGREVFLISAVTGQGLNQLTRRIAQVLRPTEQP